MSVHLQPFHSQNCGLIIDLIKNIEITNVIKYMTLTYKWGYLLDLGERHLVVQFFLVPPLLVGHSDLQHTVR